METFTAVLSKEEDMYVAHCPEIGTTSQGHTIDESIANLKEATELYLEEMPLEEKQQRSLITTFEIKFPDVKAQENIG
jgi:predicted RNase H-like HicB family nuclease